MNDVNALSFGVVADAYESGRPGYPGEAITWALGAEPLDVLEIGAGTGKLTRTLLDQGHRVLATDPSPEMLGVLRAQLDTQALLARAERLPVSSHSVDAVVCGQSFHWFDAEVALAEIARILRPEGRLVLLWNFRDLRVPWIRKLSDLIGVEAREGLIDPVAACESFTDLESHQVKSWQTHTAQTLADLTRSRSAAASLSHGDREALVARVVELYDSYGRGPDGLQMPYTTHVFRALVQHDVVTEAVPVTAAAEPPQGKTKALPAEEPGTVLIDFK